MVGAFRAGRGTQVPALGAQRQVLSDRETRSAWKAFGKGVLPAESAKFTLTPQLIPEFAVTQLSNKIPVIPSH